MREEQVIQAVKDFLKSEGIPVWGGSINWNKTIIGLHPNLEGNCVMEIGFSFVTKIPEKKRPKLSEGIIGDLKRIRFQQMIRPINPKEWYRKIRWFIQRGRRGWADCDAWDIDYHIAKILKETLPLYKNDCKWSWAEMLEHSRDSDFSRNKRKQWRKELDRAIKGFEIYLEEGTLTTPSKLKKINQAIGFVAKHFGEFWN